jgi:dolichol-phosphate mannosyltransferase
MMIRGFGAIANVCIATMLYKQLSTWNMAGGVGAIIGVVWNYAVSATLVWHL